MKRKIIWLLVSGLIIATLVLASCSPAVTKKAEVTPPTTEVTPATKEVAPAAKAGMVKLSLKKLDGTPVEKWVEAPRYGGTFILAQNKADLSWDDFFAIAGGTTRLVLATSTLLAGDWTRTPAGTAETSWFARAWYPQFEAGSVAASWEIPDAETIIYHIRKGVHWQDKPPVNGRELTANDVAFDLNRQLSTTKSVRGKRVGIGMWFISATAVDKYTMVVKGKETGVGMSAVFQEISEAIFMLPPEVIQKYGDMKDWRNVVGTGPFIAVDVVESSAATLKRNPNYFEKDPLFPENQLPYLDSVKMLLIEDESTRYAALRTHKVDLAIEVSWEDAESLLKTNPELMWSKELKIEIDGTLSPRSDTKPFDDIRVRRALAMAINRPAILRDYYRGNAQLPSPWVVNVPEHKAVYTPLEQLPESTRELFEYHPDKAKQLLAEAGYPNGFKFTAVLWSAEVDMASIYKAYLAKVGVDLELDVREYGVYATIARGPVKQYKEATFGIASLSNIFEGSQLFPGASGNYPVVNDPVINELRAKLTSFELMQNQAEIDRLAKELALYVMSQAYQISPPAPYMYQLWTPWVKNFSGHILGTIRNGAIRYLWIDQGLKAKMGR